MKKKSATFAFSILGQKKKAIHKQHSCYIHLVSFQLNLLNNNLRKKTSSCHVRILGEGEELLEMKQQ